MMTIPTRLATPAEAAVHRLVLARDWHQADVTVVLDGLRPDASVGDVASALGMAARCRHDITDGGSDSGGGRLAVIVAGLLRRDDPEAQEWWLNVCEAADEQYELLTDPNAADRWSDEPHTVDRWSWTQGRIDELGWDIEQIARKAVGRR